MRDTPVGLPGAEVLKLVLERDRLGDRNTVCTTPLIEHVTRRAQICDSPLVILGLPKDCSMMTLRPARTWSVTTVQKWGRGGCDLPLGPRVTLTALARTSTPFSMLARPSLENLISLWAPRAKIGRAAFTAALRAARDDEDEIACIVVFL